MDYMYNMENHQLYMLYGLYMGYPLVTRHIGIENGWLMDGDINYFYDG